MRPPRWPQSLLARTVADDAAGLSILGDLDEEFLERCARDGIAASRWWYWRQAVAMWWWTAWRHPHRSYHQPRGGALFDLVGDVRHAVRVARAHPGQTGLIVTMLGLAIGITTIGFSFADTALLRGLPIAEPDRTVIVYGVNAAEPDRRGGTYFSDVFDLQQRARSVERLSTWTQARATLQRSGADPLRLTISRVTGDLFGVWGLRPRLGRGLRPGDGAPGLVSAAVLSDRFWRDTFNRSPAVIGETVLIDGTPHDVVGVLTSDVEWGSFASIGVWVSDPIAQSAGRDLRPVMATGRLAAGATVGIAQAELSGIAQALEAEHPETNRGRSVLTLSADRAMGGPNLYLVITLLVGTAALVTVIASVNIAGVLLARAVVRRHEFGLRLALGAGRGRVFRQLIAEGALLAVLGAAGGLLVAEGGLRLIRSVDADTIIQQVVIDGHELLFVAALAIVAPLLFSLAPALAAVRTDLAGVLNAGGPRSIGSGRRLRDGLVAVQLALAVTLAVVGGLVVRTMTTIVLAPTGFESTNLVKFVVALDPSSADAAGRRQAVRGLVEGLASAHDGDVAAIGPLPAVESEPTFVLEPDGRAAPSGQAGRLAHVTAIDADALRILGVPVLAGQMFGATDVNRDARVALLSAEAARRYFGDARGALGRRVTIRTGPATTSYEVIGVTGDVRNTNARGGMPPRVWVPLSDPREVAIVVRTATDTAAVAASIRRVARDLIPTVPVESLESYDEAIRRRAGANRVAIGMLIAFAGAALLFAATGLYGTVALSANMRRAEFATRFALGAQVHDVAGLVLAQAARVLAMGLVPGLVGGVLAASALRRMLFGVTPLDPLNLIGVIALLTLVSVAASLAPALRASRVDVIESIRSQ